MWESRVWWWGEGWPARGHVDDRRTGDYLDLVAFISSDETSLGTLDHKEVRTKH